MIFVLMATSWLVKPLVSIIKEIGDTAYYYATFYHFITFLICLNVYTAAMFDYVERILMFNISAGNTKACEEVDILDDSTVENTEMFRIVLDPPVTPVNARLGDRAAAEVTVIDDDSKYTTRKGDAHREGVLLCTGYIHGIVMCVCVIGIIYLL